MMDGMCRCAGGLCGVVCGDGVGGVPEGRDGPQVRGSSSSSTLPALIPT
jgi:hypothetical protein